MANGICMDDKNEYGEIPLPPNIQESIKNTLLANLVKKVQEIKGTRYAFEDLPKRFQDPVLKSNPNNGYKRTRDGQVNAYKGYLIDLYINDIHSNGSFIQIPRKNECKINKNGKPYPPIIPGYIKLERTGMGIVTGFTKGVVKAVPSVLAVMAIAVLGGSSNSVSSVGASLLASATIADMATQGSSSNVHSNNARQFVQQQYSGRGTNALGFQNIVFVPISEEEWKEEEAFRKGCAYILNIPKSFSQLLISYPNPDNNDGKRAIHQGNFEYSQYLREVNKLLDRYPNKYNGFIDELQASFPGKYTDLTDLDGTPQNIENTITQLKAKATGTQGGAKKSKKTRKNKKSRRHH
jgi:hypothetical protein